MADQKIDTKVHSPEIVVAETTALTAPQQGQTPAPTVGGLAWESDPEAVVARMQKTATALRRAAIASTFPSDWISNQDRDKNIVYMLKAQGAQRCLPLLGLSIRAMDGKPDLEPEEVVQEGGKRGYRLRFLASSKTLQLFDVPLEVTRGEGELFTGRGVDDEGFVTTKKEDVVGGYGSDLRTATRTAALTKAVVTFLGLKNLPGEELDDVWKALGRSLAGVTRGAGHGSSQARTAQAVQDPAVKEKADALWKDILQRVQGDLGKAAELLYDLTVAKTGTHAGKFGIKDPALFTKADNVEWAVKRLRNHPDYGDDAIKGGAS